MQHEQSAAIAAEGYFRVNNELPLVCCTTGPGGTNTLTGVLGAWLDSIPMLIISGQIRYGTTARAAGIPVRAWAIRNMISLRWLPYDKICGNDH